MGVGKPIEPVRGVKRARLGVLDLALAGTGAVERACRPCRDIAVDLELNGATVFGQAVKLDGK